MDVRRAFFTAIVIVSAGALTGVAAQTRPASVQSAPQRPRITSTDPQFDQASVDRGQELFVGQCGFCHGSNARGGSGGPDLTRSALVQSDEQGRQVGEVLQAGRPDKGMPAFQLTSDQVADIATFLHAAIFLNANRRQYQLLDILTGDPKAGEAFFRGAARCSMCHSADGDLKGIGGRYEPDVLQGRLLMPRGAPAAGTGPQQPAYRDRNAVRVTLTLPSREVVSGALVRLTDFDVMLYDPASGAIRSWLRNGDVPKVEVVDPLQAHVDMWTKWTDADMHNVTAYLASLK